MSKHWFVDEHMDLLIYPDLMVATKNGTEVVEPVEDWRDTEWMRNQHEANGYTVRFARKSLGSYPEGSHA